MPQISLYIDKETLERIEQAAKAEQESISRWVGRQVKQALRSNYTSDFKTLYGAINDESFEVPDRNSSDLDIPREEL